MSENLINRQANPRRTATVLAMAMLSLSVLGGCERRAPQPEMGGSGSTSPAPLPPTTQTTPSPMPPASAASR